MDTGFLWRTGLRQLQCFGSAQAVERLISHASDEHATVAFMGRLYYREEIAARLAIPVAEISERDDAQLVLLLYRKLGAAAMRSLSGDCCLIVHDRSKQRIYLFRDRLGGYPLFFRVARSVTVSSSLPQIFSREESPQLDEEFIAQYLANDTPQAEPASKHTVYRGACRMLPGEIVSGSPKTTGTPWYPRVLWS